LDDSLGDVPAASTGRQFIHNRRRSVGQWFCYPHEDLPMPIKASRTTGIDSVPFQSLQSRSQVHVCPSQQQSLPPEAED
jgi:hypothetical protein